MDKVSLQAAPAAIGAMLARRQLSGAGDDDEDEQEENRRAGYVSELFLMAVGALFVALNVAPTEEMILIAYKMSAWHSLALALLSLGLLHAIVYAVGFAGQEAHDGPWRAFVHFTCRATPSRSWSACTRYGPSDAPTACPRRTWFRWFWCWAFPAPWGPRPRGCWCSDGQKSKRREASPALLEWAMAGLGLALVIGALAVVLTEGLTGGAPASVEVRPMQLARTSGGWRLEVEARNTGDETATAVGLEGVLTPAGGGEPETAEADLDYLPGGGRARAALQFKSDPRQGKLELSARGWSEP